MRTKYSRLKGVLPDSIIRELIGNGGINRASAANVGSSSLDSSLSGEGYRFPAIPLPQKDQSVRDLLKKVPGVSAFDINDPLQVGGAYLLRLGEELALPPEIYGYANPKSTTGRDDIHVRLLVDGVSAYDTIPRGYRGELWLEVKPLSFSCQSRIGLALNQLRFFTQDTRLKSTSELLAMERKHGPILLDPNGKHIKLDRSMSTDGSLLLSIYLDAKCIGYESKATSAILDLSASGTVDPEEFFMQKTMPNGLLFLKKDRFYILSSHERVRVPVDYACEMRPMDDRLGEVRVHYAGYIDDGWGGDMGAQLTLEVRPHEDMYIQAGQPIARIVFEKMAQRASKPYTKKRSNYIGQVGPKLAKHFRS